MKQIVLKYGLYGFFAALVLFALALLLGDGLSYSTQQVLGYATMVASLSFVYFGIRHFRDKKNNGKVSFMKALAIGLLISVFAACGIAVFDYFYTTVINPDFASEYLSTTLAEMRETLSADQFIIKKQELTQQMEDYGKPSTMAFAMFASTIIIGLIITIISALILKTK